MAFILMFLFMSVAGLGPSLLRAGLVSGLSLFAWYFGRKFHPGRLLVYAAAISAITAPTIVINLAWQLSFASYAGIMFLSPLLQDFFYGRKRPNYLAGIILVTFAAQLYCLPVSLYYFGQLSIVGVIGNIFVTPLISTTMFLSLSASVLPRVLAAAVAWLDGGILSYQIAVIGQLSAIKWATISIIPKSPASLLLYFPIFVITLILWRVTKHSYRPTPALDNRQKYGKIYAC
jgi:competence protein ComEC